MSQNNCSSSFSYLNESRQETARKRTRGPLEATGDCQGTKYPSRWEGIIPGSKHISKKHKKYQMMSSRAKLAVIRDSERFGLLEASRLHQVKPKNIKRWIKNGVNRKPGGGRKTQDPLMEKKLLLWIKDYMNENEDALPPRKMITQYAKSFSSHPRDFKASKGWLDKFLKRKSITGYTPSNSELVSRLSSHGNSESVFHEETQRHHAPSSQKSKDF